MLIKLVLLLDSFFGIAAFDFLEDFLVFLASFEGDSYFVSIGITSFSSVSVIRLASSPPRSSALACTLCCNSSFFSSPSGAADFSSCVHYFNARGYGSILSIIFVFC
jgi:hypothetical protein